MTTNLHNSSIIEEHYNSKKTLLSDKKNDFKHTNFNELFGIPVKKEEIEFSETKEKIKDIFGNPFGKLTEGLKTEEEEEIEEDKEKIECDSYLCFSVTMPELYLMIITPFLLTKLAVVYFHHLYIKFKDQNKAIIFLAFILSPLILVLGMVSIFFLLIFLIMIVVFLMLPGLATPTIQMVSFTYIISEVQTEFDEDSTYIQNVLIMKIVILFVLLFMVTNEATQSIKSIMYSYSVAVNKTLYFCFLCFVPQIIQLLMTFILFYVSIELIAISDSATDLIQSFAGLYVLLDLDMCIMQFLRTTKFTSLLLNIKKISSRVFKEELEGKEVFSLATMKAAFENDEVEFDCVQENKKYKSFKKNLTFLRSFVIFMLMVTLCLAGLTILLEA